MPWILLFLFITGTWAQEWDAQSYPNPTAGQFKECKMKTTANICDPDGVLSESSRYRLDHDLKQLEARTRQDNAQSFCDKKGVSAAMAIARHVKGGSTDAVKRMANDMLQRWTLDPQCQKAIVIVVSTDDMKFWVARDDKVPVYAEEFTEIFMKQKALFQQSNYQQALTNILQATWEKSLSKAGSPRASSGGKGQQPNQFNNGGNVGNSGGQGASGAGGSPFKMPSIPSWVWLALLFVVIPTLCCCLCCYCCCCRSKGGNQNIPASDGMGDGGAQPAGRAGGGGGMFGNLLRSGGGAAVGSMIGNFISRRGGGGGGGFGGGNRGQGYQGGGAYPSQPQPVYDDNGGQGGGGLYPSAAKKDEGGGGSWA